MTVVSVDPDGTTSNTGALTGGATAHAVLADSDDATYVTFDSGEAATVTFANPSIPAGAVVKSVSVVSRSASVGIVPGVTQETTLTVSGTSDRRYISLFPSTITQWSAAVLSGSRNPDPATCTVGAVGGVEQDLKVTRLRLDVTYVAKPTLDVTAPTGTFTEDNRPTVEWTNTLDSDGGPQRAAEVKLFNSAQYGAVGFDAATSTPFDSGIVTGAATSWRGNRALPNDDYRAYVQTGQIWGGGDDQSINSDWTYEAFTVDAPEPVAPTLVASPDNDASPAARIRLEITANDGTVTSDAVDIEKQNADGTWEPLRTTEAGGRETALPVTAFDFEATNGVATNYRARAVHLYTDSETYSTWTTASATLDAPRWAIHHPTIPSLSLTCDLRSFPGHDRSARQTIVQPLGRTDAVAIASTRGPETGTVVIRCPDDATRDKVMALATAAVPLLFVPPATHHERPRWMALGDEAISRLVDSSWFDERDATYQWTEVGRPDGDVIAWPGALYPSEDLYPATDLYPAG
jgi:hypothetical protein